METRISQTTMVSNKVEPKLLTYFKEWEWEWECMGAQDLALSNTLTSCLILSIKIIPEKHVLSMNRFNPI